MNPKLRSLVLAIALTAAAPVAGQAVVNLDTSETFASIQAAIDDPDTLDGHTLEMLVADHATPEVQVVFHKSLTLQGGGLDTLRPSSDTGTLGDSRAWFLVDAGETVTFRNLVFDGSGQLIWNAIRSHGTLTVQGCQFTQIKYNESGPHYSGIAITALAATGLMTVSDCTFSEIGRIGIHILCDAIIERCTYTGKGPGNFLDYFACLDSSGPSIGVATIEDCTVSGNRGVASVDGTVSGGILVSTFFGAGTEAEIVGCTLTDNTYAVNVGFDSLDTSLVNIRDSRIFDNDWGVINTSINIIPAYNNWWGDVSGPADPLGSQEADNPPCFAASFDPLLDVVNADGTGDSVTNANVDYCPWLLADPPCLSVPDVEDCTWLTSTFEGPDLADFNNIIVVHYNAGVTPGTASIANVAFIELRNAQFAMNQLGSAVPDPWNYGMNVVLPAPTSDGSNLPPALLTLDSMSGGIGEPDFDGVPALWTIDYYAGANSPGDLVGPRFHTVLFGESPDGICHLTQTFASPTEQLAQTVFHITDGIYHSVNQPEVFIPTASAWDGSAFATPIPGLEPGLPFLYSEAQQIDIGNFSDGALLTGSADPGFVTVWTRDFCTTDTIAAVTTNRLGLDIVDPQSCYKEDDIIEVELNMSCLDQDVSGFFASVSYDASQLALEPSSAYTTSPFLLHIVDPIVDSGAPVGTLFLDGSVDLGLGGTSDDALLATLYFKVLAGGDGLETSVAFSTGGTFPSELSVDGLPVPTRLADPLGFLIDQSPPLLLCPPDMSVSNDPGQCSASLSVGQPSFLEACGLQSLVGERSDLLALSDPYPAGCAPGADTLITWTATNCAGEVSTCVQTITVTDDEAPVLAGVPADISVESEAGSCSVVVSWTDPTATDNCDGAPVVVCSPPSGTSFPPGITTVTCTATDACGNQAMSTFDVEVSGVSEVLVTVELVGVTESPVSRCIHFVGGDCSATVDQTILFTDHDSNPATPVQATVMVQLPCGPNPTLCAKDEQHTTFDSTTLSIVGTTFVADTILSLSAGDTDNDGDVDVNDVTFFLFQFGNFASSGGCPWDGVTRDADFSNNGVVGSEDYSFLAANFLTDPPCPCTVSATQPGGTGGGLGAVGSSSRSRIETSRLPRSMRRVDLNADGMVDHADVRLFETAAGLPHTLSEKMRKAR